MNKCGNTKEECHSRLRDYRVASLAMTEGGEGIIMAYAIRPYRIEKRNIEIIF
jgi:hypothetical protein